MSSKIKALKSLDTLCLNQIEGAFCKELVISVNSNTFGGLRYASKWNCAIAETPLLVESPLANVWRVFKR
jgi:hypothetical protein